MTIQLSEQVTEGLKYLNSVINNELSIKLIANAIKQALGEKTNQNIPSDIYSSKPDYTKQAEYSVITLIVLAVKNNYDAEKLRKLLELYEINSHIIDELCEQFDVIRPNLYSKLLRFGISYLPQVVDVNWKLTCDIKSSSNEIATGELFYRVAFLQSNEETGTESSIVDFDCTVEELQSLINKLKDIERHCDKISCGKL